MLGEETGFPEGCLVGVEGTSCLEMRVLSLCGCGEEL